MDVYVLRHRRRFNVGEVEKLSPEEVERLPQFVKDTLAEGLLAACNRNLYGLSPVHICPSK